MIMLCIGSVAGLFALWTIKDSTRRLREARELLAQARREKLAAIAEKQATLAIVVSALRAVYAPRVARAKERAS